jgi:hypothetical protein
LGKIVPELDVKNAAFYSDKMKFSMVTPELLAFLKQRPERKSVILFGIEVGVPRIERI